MKYKITNTTVKEPKLHPRTNKDLRTATERVGHSVELRTDSGEQIIVTTTRPKVIDKLNEGIMRLQRGRFIRIEEIGDITAELKKHTVKGDIFAPDKNVTAREVQHPAADKNVTASEMGSEKQERKSGTEYEGAINPDGDPNFLVRADKNLKRKSGKKEEEVSSEG